MLPEGRKYRPTHPNTPPSRPARVSLSAHVVHPPELAALRIGLEEELTLGRSPEPDVRSVFHPTVSRAHAALRLGPDGAPGIVDLGSSNGTWVNGVRVGGVAVPLAAQSVLRLGDVLAVVDAASEAAFEDDPALPGTGLGMVRLREQLTHAAADAASVLILGETGSGKEHVARALHERSGRAGPFVALNCAELAPELVESALFGHERGAFTGAHAAKQGLFLAAHGGTLFLDEVGELPLELQPKLLRVLEVGEVRPLGGVETKRVDVRVVAATNRELAELTEQGRFRRDLYARLALWELRLPPLRARKQDLFAWVGRFSSRWNAERGGGGGLQFLPDAAERLLLYSFPDNLRGVARLVHRLSSASPIGPVGVSRLLEALPELASSTASGAETLALGLESGPPPGSLSTPPAAGGARRPTREEVLAVYQSTGGSVRAMSKHFGKDRRQIYRWLESFGIERSSNEPE